MMRSALLALSRSKLAAQHLTESRVAWLAASRFVAGLSAETAMEVVRELNAAGMTVTLDHLGENVSSRREVAENVEAYHHAIDQIEAAGVRSGISLKLTALGLDLGDDVAASNLRRVLDRAGQTDPPTYVRIDMEGSDYTARTFDIFYQTYPDYPHLGVVVQSYLYRTDDDVEDLIQHGAGVRLVKGAYLEPEDIAYPDKADVDRAFARQTERLMSAEARQQGVYPAIATHDEALIEHTIDYAAQHEIPADAYEFQMLYGVRRDLQESLVERGYRVRIYVPYGRQWYPYFMRRMAERPENVGFILSNLARELAP